MHFERLSRPTPAYYQKKIRNLKLWTYFLSLSLFCSLCYIAANSIYLPWKPARPEQVVVRVPDSSTKKDVEVIKQILATLVPAVDRLTKTEGVEPVVRVKNKKAVLKAEPDRNSLGMGEVEEGLILVRQASEEKGWIKVYSPMGKTAYIEATSVELQ